VQLTELDFKASQRYDGTQETYDAEDERLALRYQEFYQAVKELREEGMDFAGIIIWGVIDPNSWLQTSNSAGGGADGTRTQMPLLFDGDYQAKKAFWALADDTKLISEETPVSEPESESQEEVSETTQAPSSEETTESSEAEEPAAQTQTGKKGTALTVLLLAAACVGVIILRWLRTSRSH